MKNDLLTIAKSRAEEWLKSSIDEDSKAQIRKLIASEDPKTLIDSFYKSLEFGTGGLRGLMVKPFRM